MKRWRRIAIFCVVVGGTTMRLAGPAMAQSCDDVRALLSQGNSVQQIIQLTGLNARQIEECRGAQKPSFYSPQGPAPHGAAGPPPLGAAGPAPHGAAGPPPHGAAGPAPFGRQ
ncbi:MAG TPA: hypothetical protein VMW17_11360 [Candidatus Binatia bacterium]|nr:hypothetical protein [Candidatus Binatia bacterium]